jgi:hypothetical protein
MELPTILVAIFCFVILKNHMDQKAKERGRKLQILEEAIKGGNLDRDMVDDLAATLSGRRPARRPQAEPRPRGTWFLALGWIGIFIGLGILALGGMTDGRDADELMGAGLVVALISFGVTTYPFALRELEARRRA